MWPGGGEWKWIRMRQLVLAMIRFYQRFVSPLKGYACAYRVHTGHASCSNLGYRAIRRFGVLRGLSVLRLRLERCGDIHRRHHRPHWPALRQQAGFCEPDCDIPCDCNDMPCDISDLPCELNCADLSCDLLSDSCDGNPCTCDVCGLFRRKSARRRRRRALVNDAQLLVHSNTRV